MRVEAHFQLDAAQVDTNRRRIVGRILPFGEIGNVALGGLPAKLQFDGPGSLVWASADAVKLVVNHHAGAPVMAGKARDLVETRTDIIGTFSVARTTAGNDLLVEAAEGLRTGFSIEAEIPDEAETDSDGVIHVTAEHPAQLHQVAAVVSPAFVTAQVTSVAASTMEGNKMTAPTTDVAAAEVPDDDVKKLLGDLTGAISTLNAALAQPAADHVPADAEGTPAAASLFGKSSTQVTREPFPYGHAGAEGVSFFRDLMAGSTGDTEARARTVKAQKMWEDVARSRQLTAADEPVTKANVFVPNAYDTSLYVGQVKIPRVIADRMPLTAISSSRPIIVPKLTSALGDGATGEIVSAHTEGTNPASGEIVIGSVSSTPLAYSGKVDVNREAVDAGDPTVDEIILGAIRESYAQVTEAAAVTALLATSGADTGSSTTNANLEIEAQNMYKLVRRYVAKFGTTRGLQPDIVFYAPEQFVEAVAADGSTSGLALYPQWNPTNMQSKISGIEDLGPVLSALNVPGVNAPLLTAAKVVIARTSDLHRWESPLLTFKWEEVAGPAKIRFVGFGYAKFAGLQGKGVTILTQA